MPTAPTYPGVYIEEIPSGVRTITGVATSITAFIGRALRGPTSDPTPSFSFGDFERQFGGLAVSYPMSYAVRDFFVNGGSQALIVRLFKVGAAGGDGAAHLTIDTLKLVAASPGLWGENLRVAIDTDVASDVKAALGLPADGFLINLTVEDSAPGGATERFYNLTIVDSARRIDKVLEAESNLVRWDGVWAQTKPADLPLVKKATDAEAAVAAAQGALAAAQAAKPPVQATIDAATAALKAATDGLQTANTGLVDAGTKADVQLAAALAAKPVVPATVAAGEAAVKAAGDGTKASDSDPLDDATYEGSQDIKTGLFALDKADLFNLLCIPPDDRANGAHEDTSSDVYQHALSYCESRRAMLIVDSPAAWSVDGKVTAAADAAKGLPDLNLTGDSARNAALYFPRVREADPLRDSQIDTFVPCGIVAGIMARTDTTRGVWKAPAGLDATLSGVQALDVNLSDGENGLLNPLGINCLRFFPVGGRVIWGSRTLRGADRLADEYKYVPVRRTALFLEESLYRGLQWVVFEPNDEPLWSQIRLNVGAFMQSLFRQGAFQGTTPKDAYFVKCDKETTTQTDINLGIVNIIVGFAPLKPAEFVIVKLQQMAGQIPT